MALPSDAPNDIDRAVFPIIRRRYGSFEELCGTGSFVMDNSLFITSAHTIEDQPAEYFAAIYPYDLADLSPIQWGISDPIVDLVFGTVPTLGNTQALSHSDRLPVQGSKITVPGFRYRVIRNGSLMLDRASIEHVEGVYLGHSQEVDIPFGNYRKRFPAVMTAPRLQTGFSGAPILDEEGNLIAVHSGSYENGPSMNVRLDAVLNLFNLQHEQISEEQYYRWKTDFSQPSPDPFTDEG